MSQRWFDQIFFYLFVIYLSPPFTSNSSQLLIYKCVAASLIHKVGNPLNVCVCICVCASTPGHKVGFAGVVVVIPIL